MKKEEENGALVVDPEKSQRSQTGGSEWLFLKTQGPSSFHYWQQPANHQTASPNGVLQKHDTKLPVWTRWVSNKHSAFKCGKGFIF